MEQRGSQFVQSLGGRSFKGVRVAMFRDMGLPWEPEVKETVRAEGRVFESLGWVVEETEPDFRDANECFLTWRHWTMESRFGDLVATKGDQLNEYVHWHVEEGRKLTGPYLSRVEMKRSALYQRLYEFQYCPEDDCWSHPNALGGKGLDGILVFFDLKSDRRKGRLEGEGRGVRMRNELWPNGFRPTPGPPALL